MPSPIARCAAVLSIALACGTATQQAAADNAALRTVKLNGYVISVERTVDQGMMGQDLLTVRKGGRLYHAETGAHIQFTTPKEPLSDLPALVAITGRSAYDIVVQSYSGGAHCCFAVTILTLAAPFAASAPLDTQSAGAALFKLPEGGYGIQTAEGTFDYWRTSYAESPEPTLYLRYDASSYSYELVPALMRKPAPANAELDKTAKHLRDDAEAWKVGPELVSPAYLKALIDLIYGGDLDGARGLAAAGWPETRPGRDAFLKDLFSCELPSSPWWPGIAALNRIAPYERAQDCN